MGRNKAVPCLEQGVISPDRLSGHHVQAGSPHFAGIQRLLQILFHNQRASGVIEDDYPVLHLCNGIPVNHSRGIGKQRTVKGYHIGHTVQFIQISVTAVFIFQGLIPVSIIGQDLHAKGLGNAGRSLPNPPKSYDAHGLSRQLNQRIIPETPVRTALPPAFTDSLAVMADMMADFQKQCNGILGNCIRPVGRDIAYRNPPG